MVEDIDKFECNCCTNELNCDKLKKFCTNDKCKWNMCYQCHDILFFKGFNNKRLQKYLLNSIGSILGQRNFIFSKKFF